MTLMASAKRRQTWLKGTTALTGAVLGLATFSAPALAGKPEVRA
jgi:hypothetical protein